MRLYADLHVHIGKAKNHFVKITASQKLTIRNILHYTKAVKGIDIVGIIDCGSKPVLAEIKELLESGELRETTGGGLLTEEGLLLILGWEVEIEGVHFLIYLPSLDALKKLTQILWPRTKNCNLSTQRFSIPHKEIRQKTESMGGLFVPAHAFTPHKGLYGKQVDSLYELFDKPFVAIEMGLSGSSEMINGIKELDKTTFLSNSDAHSLPKIAREYNEIELGSLSFEGLKDALIAENVVANYGLDPRLGKYYETGCLSCGKIVKENDRCSCGQLVTKGVKPRLEQLGGYKKGRKRPPYIKQVPLEFLPGIGPKTILKLRDLGTELEILNTISLDKIASATSDKIAAMIGLSRDSSQGEKLNISTGKAGFYGKVQLKNDL